MWRQRFDIHRSRTLGSAPAMIPDDPTWGHSPRSRPDASPNLQAPSASAASRSSWSDVDTGTVIVAEFVSAILTWGGIGWLFDRWLHTKPWLLVIGFVVGAVAGFFLLYLRSHNMIVTQDPPAESAGTAEQ
jgi:F0F1-type ATP synthase assembly protein I